MCPVTGAAHGAPPVGWSSYGGITKAAFFQSFKVLEREFREAGGKVVIGSFKPGVVDTTMQGTIRSSSDNDKDMPFVQALKNMKENVDVDISTVVADPPPKGALETPANVAHFGEYLLIGTMEDEEFANKDDPSEWDIRNAALLTNWIPEENLPKGVREYR
jgi:hypothetical protein